MNRSTANSEEWEKIVKRANLFVDAFVLDMHNANSVWSEFKKLSDHYLSEQRKTICPAEMLEFSRRVKLFTMQQYNIPSVAVALEFGFAVVLTLIQRTSASNRAKEQAGRVLTTIENAFVDRGSHKLAGFADFAQSMMPTGLEFPRIEPDANAASALAPADIGDGVSMIEPTSGNLTILDNPVEASPVSEDYVMAEPVSVTTAVATAWVNSAPVVSAIPAPASEEPPAADASPMLTAGPALQGYSTPAAVIDFNAMAHSPPEETVGGDTPTDDESPAPFAWSESTRVRRAPRYPSSEDPTKPQAARNLDFDSLKIVTPGRRARPRQRTSQSAALEVVASIAQHRHVHRLLASRASKAAASAGGSPGMPRGSRASTRAALSAAQGMANKTRAARQPGV